VFEQQARNLQRPTDRGPVQRSPGALALRIYICTML
jgi:hypothetical protein